MFKQKRYLIGGGLKASTLQALLDASYSGVGNVEGFILDKKISSKTAKVYVHQTGQVVVAHTGTYNSKDWINNGVFGIGGETAYRQTARFKSSEKVQKSAEKKYGAKNITVLGHSQAGLLAQMLGKNSKEIITLNKATRPQEMIYGSSKKNKQFDVRSQGDVVSLWRNPFQKSKQKDITIKNKTGSLLQEHSVDILGRLDKDKVIGKKNTYVN